MKIYCKTRKSHRWNEDRFVRGHDFCIVLDGATPLKKSGRFNEARWLVDYLKKNITRYDGDIKSRLLELCKKAYHEFPADIKEQDYLPSASACWAEWSNEKIRIGILGDCEVTAITKDGEILRCYDDRLRKLDDIAIQEMVSSAHKHSSTILEARNFIDDTLIKHRNLINKPDGYSALTLSLDPKINEKAFQLEKDKIKNLYLYSDGFSQAFENLKIYRNHVELFKQIESIDGEIDKIVKTSFEDRNCNKFPRFKIIDDITVVKIDF